MFHRIQKKQALFIAYVTPTTTLITNYTKNSVNDKNLALFIPNDSNLEESIEEFVRIYSKRMRGDKDYWLVDISTWPDMYNVIKDFKDIPLDLDDDLFLYKPTNIENGIIDSLEMYEFYEIHKSKPRKILSYGEWSLEKGLILPNEGKWVRRKDLEVCALYVMHTYKKGFHRHNVLT